MIPASQSVFGGFIYKQQMLAKVWGEEEPSYTAGGNVN
jgi:hypothetical protein